MKAWDVQLAFSKSGGVFAIGVPTVAAKIIRRAGTGSVPLRARVLPAILGSAPVLARRKARFKKRFIPIRGKLISGAKFNDSTPLSCVNLCARPGRCL